MGNYQGSYKVALKFANMLRALLKAPWTFLLNNEHLIYDKSYGNVISLLCLTSLMLHKACVESVTNWANDAMFNINLHMKFD